MDLRRRLPPKPPSATVPNHHHHKAVNDDDDNRSSSYRNNGIGVVGIVDRSPSPVPKASDALPLPLYLTNGIFFTLFFSVAYYLLHRWRDKIRSSTPLHVVTLSELAAIVSLIASFIYLLGFFGIDFVQSFITTARGEEDSFVLEGEVEQCSETKPRIMDPVPSIVLTSKEDEEIVESVVCGSVPSYSLESKLGDCLRAASIRRQALERTTGRSLVGLPLEGFDYESILGQCCEMPVGYVQLPVGIAGPLLLNGCEYMVPMATTEGCLVASTNRGCKAIFASGGATAILLKDGMTRAPVVRFDTAERASQLKFFLEDPINFDTLSVMFNK